MAILEGTASPGSVLQCYSFERLEFAASSAALAFAGFVVVAAPVE